MILEFVTIQLVLKARLLRRSATCIRERSVAVWLNCTLSLTMQWILADTCAAKLHLKN
jgi:hypothetical protein